MLIVESSDNYQQREDVEYRCQGARRLCREPWIARQSGIGEERVVATVNKGPDIRTQEATSDCEAKFMPKRGRRLVPANCNQSQRPIFRINRDAHYYPIASSPAKVPNCNSSHPVSGHY